MSDFLHRLGAYCFEKRWQVISIWLILLALLGAGAFMLKEPVTTAISIPGTQAQTALERVNELFPGGGEGSAKVVVESPDGSTVRKYAETITNAANDIKKVEGVTNATSPFNRPDAVSPNGTIAFIDIQLEQGNGSVKDATTAGVEKQVEALRDAGLTAETGGDVISQAPDEILGIGEVGGVLIALFVLVITLGSLIAAGMPLLVALLAIGISMGGLFSLSQFVTISSTTPVLAVMLGLAVGIDYSLFIVSKYRSYLLDGVDPRQAAAKSIATAGSAVVFAALTVVIALAALSVIDIPFITTMGLTGAATIAVAAVVALTLLPALLSLSGRKIFGRRARKSADVATGTPKQKTSTFWYKWGRAITAKPLLSLLVGLAVIVTIALPARELTLGLPSDATSAADTTERKAYELIEKGFGAGYNGPLLVLVENMPPVAGETIGAVDRQVADAFQQKAGIQDLTTMTPEQRQMLTKVQAEALQKLTLKNLNDVAQNIANDSRVEAAFPAKATDDGTKGIIQAISKTDPSSQATNDLLAYLRNDNSKDSLTDGNDYEVFVTGRTALQTDINNKLANALPVYLAVVIGLSLILLLIAFRSILVPLKATIGFLLSVAAMFGAIVAVFQWGWFDIADAPGPIVSFIPILAIGILFGLAMDYEFFLVSSMHDSYRETGNARQAVVNGFGAGSKVVTAAAVIMIAVFSGFVTNHDATIQAIGFGLAIGILVDAFIVRMTIVPAVMMLLGKSAWWLPKWLDKIIPHVSIEGKETTRKSKNR